MNIQRLQLMIRIVVFASIAFLCMAASSRYCFADQVVKYDLYNVVLSDGSDITGTFDFDFTSNRASNISISESDGLFNGSESSSVDATTSGISGTYTGESASIDLQLAFAHTLSPTSGADISTSPSASYLKIASATTSTLTVVSGAVIPVDALPSTTVSLAGTPNTNAGWYKGPVTVTLTAKAGANPIGATYYNLDGGAQTAYSAPFAVTGDAVHTLVFWSVDTAGYQDTPGFVVIKNDGTPPAVSAYQWGEAVALSASDAVSGVAAIYYTLNGGARQTYTSTIYAPVGPNKVYYWAVDFAGNRSATQSLTFTATDTIPPTAPGAPHVVSTSGTSETIAWMPSTDNVGVTGYTISYLFSRSGRGGGSSWRVIGTTTTPQITITGYTGRTLGVVAFDAAGNKSAVAYVK